MKLAELIYSTATNKCPRCHQGDVFVSKNPYNFSKMFEVHKHCSHCDLKYEKEPSFFYGSMYVSYALTSGWFIVWFALQNFVLDWDTLNFGIFIAVTLTILSPLSLRWSRLIWLNFFYKYDKSLSKSNKHQTLSYDKHH